MVSRRFAWGRVRFGFVRDAAWADVGQGTVEAALVLPVLLIALLLLIQPGILLYDRIVMENAAA